MSLRSVEDERLSNTFMVAPTMEGANEFENKYGLERCLSISTIGDLAAINPPEAPPKALPKVPVIISGLPNAPACSLLPLPLFPTKPVA